MRLPNTLYPLGGTVAAPLPYDAVVEYIKSTGTQWIDTGWIPSLGSGSGITVDCSYDGGNTASCIWGCNVGGYYQLNKTTTSKQFRLHTVGTSQQLFTLDAPNARHVYSLSGRVLSVDGVVVATGGSGATATNSLALSARHGSGTGRDQIATITIYSAQLYTLGTLVRDFQPVRVGTAGALYDRVSGQLFLSATSTPLVAGPDKTP